MHRTGDTTDCGKLSFDRYDVYMQGKDLEQFLRQNLIVKLLDDDSQRIKKIKLNNPNGLFGKCFNEHLIVKVQARMRMIMTRNWYLRYLSGIHCVYYTKMADKVARITVRKVVFNKIKNVRDHKEKHHYKNANDKTADKVEE